MTAKETKSPEQLRKELLGQLRFLIREVESLKGVVNRVPERLQEGRPLEGDLSIKEIYALLARLDEEVHQSFVQEIRGGRCPEITVSHEELLQDVDWNDQSIDEILRRVQTARSSLVKELEQLDVQRWQQGGEVHDQEMDVYKLAHFITQHDVDRMREIGYRLHESQMR